MLASASSQTPKPTLLYLMFSQWIRRRETPLQRRAYALALRIRKLNIRRGMWFYRFLYALRRGRKAGWRWLKAKFYYEPMLRSQSASVGRDLELYDDIPNILGALEIHLGDRVRIEGDHTWLGAKADKPCVLRIGDDTYLGYQVAAFVGDRIEIGSNVLISNRVILAGYDNHPMDPVARAANAPPGPEGRGPIVIRDYAWICTNVKIMKNVTIGKGAVVAAGAVVTRDVPDLTVVAGNPAKVVKTLPVPESWESYAQQRIAPG